MTGWSGMAGEHEFVVPDQAHAQGLANALADYGFALVAAGPRRQGGGWGVRAYDYGPYPSDRVGYRGFYAVARHAVALARQHGGYWTGGSQCDPSMLPSSPPDAPIVLANPGNRPPVPTLVINPPPPTARLALTPDRVRDTAADAVDLTRLEDIPWAQLDQAHGGAADVPDLIRALAHQPDDFTAVLDELLGDDLLHQGTCYSATAPAMPFLTRLLISGSLPASRRLELSTWLVFAAGRWAASLLWDADRAAAHHRPPAADPWTQDVRRAVAGELPALFARWGEEPPALRYVLACLAALYPDQGRKVADTEHAGPQAGEVRNGGDATAAVAADLKQRERGGHHAGQHLQVSQPLALDPWAAPPPGRWWRQLVKRGVAAQPGRHLDLGGQPRQRLAGIGGVTDQVDATVGQALADEPDQLARQVELGAAGLAGPPQPGQHRQAHRPVGHKRQVDQHPDHDPAVGPADRPAALAGGASGS